MKRTAYPPATRRINRTAMTPSARRIRSSLRCSPTPPRCPDQSGTCGRAPDDFHPFAVVLRKSLADRVGAELLAIVDAELDVARFQVGLDRAVLHPRQSRESLLHSRAA